MIDGKKVLFSGMQATGSRRRKKIAIRTLLYTKRNMHIQSHRLFFFHPNYLSMPLF